MKTELQRLREENQALIAENKQLRESAVKPWTKDILIYASKDPEGVRVDKEDLYEVQGGLWDTDKKLEELVFSKGYKSFIVYEKIQSDNFRNITGRRNNERNN